MLCSFPFPPDLATELALPGRLTVNSVNSNVAAAALNLRAAGLAGDFVLGKRDRAGDIVLGRRGEGLLTLLP